MTNLESFLFGVGLALISLSVYVIVDTASQYERVVNLPTDQRPVIPYCDKELWERITDGCP